MGFQILMVCDLRIVHMGRLSPHGNSYATAWASHHYGLVSGNNETDTLITSHSGNEWACGGYTGPNGEGFTGRGGISNFRLWVK